MTAMLVVARAELRSRLLSMLALAILLGLSSGAVMTLAAGARRTDSAYERFAREHKAADMLIYPAFDPETFAFIDLDTIAALPQVAASGRQYLVAATDPAVTALAPGTGMGKTINVPKLIEGRLPKADSLDETAISFTLAKNRHLHLGGSIKLDFAPTTGPPPVPRTLRIVGIEASPGEFPPQLNGFGGSDKGGVLQVSSAFYESMKKKGIFTLEFLALRFKRGAADFAAVNEELNKLANGKPQLNQNLGAQAANVQRSIHLQAVALRIVAGLVALISLLVLSQLIARQASIDAAESPILRALGMTRRQVALTGLSRSAAVGLVGAVVGVAIVAATSPLTPIGLARAAEPNTGFSLDAVVIGLGVLATVVIVLALAAWPLWRNSKTLPEVVGSSKPSMVARSAAATGFSPAMSTGVSLALEPGRGRTAVPVRSSLTSVTVAIVGLASALTFGAGLDHLLSTPRQYGYNWDGHITTNDEQRDINDALKVLEADPEVQDVAEVDTPPVTFGTVAFDAIALGQRKGSIEPRVIDGHAPRAANEIAVGARSLREAHVRIGSTVHVSIAAISGGGAEFTVVGTVVVPPNSDTTRLGSGGVVTREGELRMVPEGYTGVPPLTDAYFTLAPGVDHRKALARIAEKTKNGYSLQPLTRPTDLVNFGQVQNLPLLLAGLVALLAAATLAQTLVTSIRRRRRDLAILKMLGFVPGQVRWAIAWQATTFVSAALLVGLPIGVVAGRLVWTAFSNQLGTPPEPVTPSIQLLLTIPAAVLLANIVAAAPAVIAGRMKPATALRAE